MTIIEIDMKNLCEIQKNAREIRYEGKLIFARFYQKFFIYELTGVHEFYKKFYAQ